MAFSQNNLNITSDQNFKTDLDSVSNNKFQSIKMRNYNN